jgi:hypothetical protein
MKPPTEPTVRNDVLTWEVPEVYDTRLGRRGCTGCVFFDDSVNPLAVDPCRWNWPLTTTLELTAASKTCFINTSIFIPATPEGWAEYIALKLS